MDKETAPHSTNTLEQNTRKRTRNQNWEWDDIFTFISIVNKEGKNWLKVHSQHQITHITDHTKLATQAAERKAQREERNKTLQKSVEEEINSTTY